MTDEIISLLAVHDYFSGLPADVLAEVAQGARLMHHPAGTVAHEADAVLERVGFVLRGRLKAVRVDSRGVESLFRMIDRGEQYGMMIGALAEPVPIRIVALEPTTVLELDYERAMDLTARYPELRGRWLKSFAGSMRKHFFGTTDRRAAMLLALISETPAMRKVASRLVDRLRELGERLAVFGDPDTWQPRPDVRFRPLVENGTFLDPAEIRRQAAHWQDATRIIFDVPAGMEGDRLVRLMEIADRAVYFAPASGADAALRRLRSLDVPRHGWRDKVRIAWLLGDGPPVGPPMTDFRDSAVRDFKLVDTSPSHPYASALANGLERLVHELRGVRIGVALGGGAARGMSHLGVLKALERNGIVVDMIAGTSAGAMTGIVYATGLDCDYAAAQFSADLRPSWLFRTLPHGDHWYLLYKYRRGHFDPMLRNYLRDWRLEQLAVPCRSVTVNLVGGSSIVRDQGDAVHAVLESINIPVLSAPICRGGQALIDGGLVNNIPADVLVQQGCNFVIAVSVTAQMEKSFGNITPENTPRKRPSAVQTILRSLLVQNYSLNAIGVQPADVVITPDVTGFELTEFTRAREMAAVGEAAALEQIPQVRRLLHRMDPQLFPPFTAASG